MRLGLDEGDQKEPRLGVDGAIFSGLDISQQALENRETFGNISRDCLDSMNIWRNCLDLI